MRIDTSQFNNEVYFASERDNGNMNGNATIVWPSGNKQKITVVTSGTLTFSAPDGPTNLLLKIVNGGSVGFTPSPKIKYSGGTEPTWTASGIDILSMYYDGSAYYGMVGTNFL